MVHDTVASIWVNDMDANGYSLHTSSLLWVLAGRYNEIFLGMALGFTWLVALHELGEYGNVIPKNASSLYSGKCERYTIPTRLICA